MEMSFTPCIVEIFRKYSVLFLFLQAETKKPMKALLLNIELNRALFLKFLKFGVVGLTGVFVNFGVTYVCKEWFKWNKYLSNILGFVVAASTNYLLNRIWTFESSNPQIGVEYVKYFAIALVGLGIDTFTVWLLNGKLKWNFYLSKVFAVGASTLWNFFGNLLFTFA
jgi:putative flippase GtrA